MLMVKSYFSGLIIVFLFLLQACTTPDDFPPKSVPFEFVIQEEKGNSSNILSFDKGSLMIETIEFEGIKENGNNYYFESNFDTLVTANLQQGTTDPKVEFDIPQGIYNRVKLAIDIPELQGQPSLLLEGIFNFPPGKGNNPNLPDQDKKIPVRVVIDFGLDLELNGKTNKKNNSEIVFNQNQPSKLQVTIDPVFWFRPVSPNLLRNAEITENEGNSEIVISKTQNENIFELIINRIEKSTEAVFIY